MGWRDPVSGRRDTLRSHRRNPRQRIEQASSRRSLGLRERVVGLASRQRIEQAFGHLSDLRERVVLLTPRQWRWLNRQRAGMAWTALVLGLLVVPASVLVAVPPVVRFPFVLAFVCFGPGLA